jgi:phosphoribosylaminoimidazole-succinocarboxamide synthase
MRHAGSMKYSNAGTCSISQNRPTSKTGKMSSEAIVNIDIQGRLPKVASGKVRDLYAIDDETLLFVASDRISAYDVIMENVSQMNDKTLLPHL